MSNIEKYRQAFVESLEIKPEEVLTANMSEIERWDSIGHMSLIAVMEDTFGIEFMPDDITEFTSYEKGLEILKTKYGISFE